MASHHIKQDGVMRTLFGDLGLPSKGRRTEGMVFSPPPGTVTLHTYDDQFVVLPASAALHSKRLRNDFLEENGARRGVVPAARGVGRRSAAHSRDWTASRRAFEAVRGDGPRSAACAEGER